jgi:hypothetical protein
MDGQHQYMYVSVKTGNGKLLWLARSVSSDRFTPCTKGAGRAAALERSKWMDL